MSILTLLKMTELFTKSFAKLYYKKIKCTENK